jgi:hypothetical protein
MDINWIIERRFTVRPMASFMDIKVPIPEDVWELGKSGASSSPLAEFFDKPALLPKRTTIRLLRLPSFSQLWNPLPPPTQSPATTDETPKCSTESDDRPRSIWTQSTQRLEKAGVEPLGDAQLIELGLDCTLVVRGRVSISVDVPRIIGWILVPLSSQGGPGTTATKG